MSATAPGEVDLIVVDWDGGEASLNCLQPASAQTHLPSRVLLVDNGSRLPVYQRLPKDLEFEAGAAPSKLRRQSHFNPFLQVDEVRGVAMSGGVPAAAAIPGRRALRCRNGRSDLR